MCGTPDSEWEETGWSGRENFPRKVFVGCLSLMDMWEPKQAGGGQSTPGIRGPTFGVEACDWNTVHSKSQVEMRLEAGGTKSEGLSVSC